MRKDRFSTGNIPIPSLEGVFFITASAQSVQDEQYSPMRQQYDYRSITGARLHVKVRSCVGEGCAYTTVPASDSKSDDDRTWTHVNQTTTRVSRKKKAAGFLSATRGGPMSHAEISVQVSGAKPFSEPCFSKVVYLPLS